MQYQIYYIFTATNTFICGSLFMAVNGKFIYVSVYTKSLSAENFLSMQRNLCKHIYINLRHLIRKKVFILWYMKGEIGSFKLLCPMILYRLQRHFEEIYYVKNWKWQLRCNNILVYILLYIHIKDLFFHMSIITALYSHLRIFSFVSLIIITAIICYLIVECLYFTKISKHNWMMYSF